MSTDGEGLGVSDRMIAWGEWFGLGGELTGQEGGRWEDGLGGSSDRNAKVCEQLRVKWCL